MAEEDIIINKQMGKNGAELFQDNDTIMTHCNAGSLGNEKSQTEVDFYIIPTKKLKLKAMSYCTKHGLWESEAKEVTVQ